MKEMAMYSIHSLGHTSMVYTLLHSFHKIFAPFPPYSFNIFAVTPSDTGVLFFFSFNTASSISPKRIPGSCSSNMILFPMEILFIWICVQLLTISPPAFQNYDMHGVCLHFSIFIFDSRTL